MPAGCRTRSHGEPDLASVEDSGGLVDMGLPGAPPFERGLAARRQFRRQVRRGREVHLFWRLTAKGGMGHLGVVRGDGAAGIPPHRRPVGPWPVHGLCGIWGSLSLGLFANGQYSAAGSSPFGMSSVVAKSPDKLNGLFYGGGFKVLAAQGIGSLIVCSATFATAMAMFAALKAVRLPRVSHDGELQGLDLDQHGISAYPDYVISALSTPHGMVPDAVGSGNLARAPEIALGTAELDRF